MRSDVKTEWLEALRDGEYEQGRYQLRELGDLFDPVGVLCDLAVKAGVIGEPKEFSKTTGATQFFGWQYGGECVRLPKPVEDWSGLSYWQANHIIFMGDRGNSFAKIADYIQETL